MWVIAGSQVLAIAFNIDRNFLRSSTNWKQRRPDKHLLQYRKVFPASPSSCVRSSLLVPFTILSVWLVYYYYCYFFLHLNALVHVLTFPVWRTKVKLEPRADWPVMEAATARLCCSSTAEPLGAKTSQLTVNVQMICIADYLYLVITKIEIQF